MASREPGRALWYENFCPFRVKIAILNWVSHVIRCLPVVVVDVGGLEEQSWDGLKIDAPKSEIARAYRVGEI